MMMRNFLLLLSAALLAPAAESNSADKVWASQERCQSGDARMPIPAGNVLLGEDGPGHPGRSVFVAAFVIDRHEVTNRQFAAFVDATAYRTKAEREGKSAIFAAPTEPVPLDNPGRWWHFQNGADWHHPQGPGSSIVSRENEPVVHVDREDAAAYAHWTRGVLPSEAQW